MIRLSLLCSLLLRLPPAPDTAGNPQALARRMGVEELTSLWSRGR